MDHRIAPIEKPVGLKMRLGFYFFKKLFGKVITPAKTIYNRVPGIMFIAKEFNAVEEKLTLDPVLVKLVKHHVAFTNGCAFCIDINMRNAIDKKLYSDKFKEMHKFEASMLFTDKERTAFRYVEVITREKIVSDALFAEMKKHFNDTEIVEITYLCAMENFYNCMNIPLGIESDNLCALVS